MAGLSGGLLATAMAALLTAPAQAQSIEEFASMACPDFLALTLETQVGVLFWIDGWLSRENGDMQLEFVDVAYAIRDLEDSCARQPTTTLASFFDLRF